MNRTMLRIVKIEERRSKASRYENLSTAELQTRLFRIILGMLESQQLDIGVFEAYVADFHAELARARSSGLREDIRALESICEEADVIVSEYGGHGYSELCQSAEECRLVREGHLQSMKRELQA